MSVLTTSRARMIVGGTGGRLSGRELASPVSLVVAAALLPARGNWVAGLVLIAVALFTPGIVLLRAIRVPTEAIRAFPLYVPAASILVLMVGGLATDLIAPALGNHTPLHGDTTALVVLGIAAALWFIGPAAASGRGWSWPTISPLTLLPFLLPAGAAVGALLLTNGHGDVVARVAAIVTVGALGTALVLARRMSRATTVSLLFACALAVEWSYSLRSHNIIGFDISTELGIAQRTLAAGIWHANQHGNAYAAMLSITILPSVIASLTGCAPLLAFKVLYPVLTAMLPVGVYLLAGRFIRQQFAVLAASLLLVQYYFFNQLPQLARQEIGLLFFMTIAVGLLDTGLGRTSRRLLIALFAAGLVLSHYSSAYFAIPTLGIGGVLILLAGPVRRYWRFAAAAVATAAALAAGAVFWYGPITHSSSNLSSFVTKLDRSGLDFLPSRSGNVINTYFTGTLTRAVSGAQFQQIAARSYADRRYIHPLPEAREARYTPASAQAPEPAERLATLRTGTRLDNIAVQQLFLVTALLGGLALLVRRRSSIFGRQLAALALGTVGILALSRFSGTISIEYNQTRSLLQAALLLTIPSAWLVELVWSHVGKLRSVVIPLVTVALVIYFAQQTSLTSVATGGGTDLNLSSSGETMERYYITPQELAGAAWAYASGRHGLLYSDAYGQLRIEQVSGYTPLLLVTPRSLDRGAWLYGTHTNVVLGRARGGVGYQSAVYEWPGRFLTNYFDTVFTNGSSKVYHR